MERILKERRSLSARFDELIDHVRSQPGMSRFLQNLGYMDLSSAAIRGPVVILQLNWICVITAPQTDPQIIPLHEVTEDWLHGAANTFRLAVHRVDDRGLRKRPGSGNAGQRSDEYKILTDIWRRIVQPLLNILGWEVS
jgi:hypothetical protein